MFLNNLNLGERCKVTQLNAHGSIRRRLLDLGIVENTEIEALNQSPSGNLVAYLIRGAVVALRNEDASTIQIKSVQ